MTLYIHSENVSEMTLYIHRENVSEMTLYIHRENVSEMTLYFLSNVIVLSVVGQKISLLKDSNIKQTFQI